MIVDVHAHILPPSVVEAARSGRELHGIGFGMTDEGRMYSEFDGRRQAVPREDFAETLETRLANMDAAGVDVHVLSMAPSLYYYGVDAAEGAAFARLVNDEVAGIVRRHPDRFYAFGYLPLQDVAASVAEAERVLADPAFLGVVVGTNVNGADFDDPGLLPVFETAARLGALVFIHPTRVRSASFLPRHHLRNLIGNPLETTIAFASLALGGVLDRLPELQVCLAHGGGYACLGIGRFDHGWTVRPEIQVEDQPSRYLRRVYVDSLVHDPDTLRLVVDRVGADRVLLGSDYPADMGQPRPVEWIRSCDVLSDDEREAILGGNFARILAGRRGVAQAEGSPPG